MKSGPNSDNPPPIAAPPKEKVYDAELAQQKLMIQQQIEALKNQMNFNQ